MPQARQPDSSPPFIPAMTSVCPACAKQMRIESLAPDERYINLDRARYRCSCGLSVDNFVARKE